MNCPVDLSSATPSNMPRVRLMKANNSPGAQECVEPNGETTKAGPPRNGLNGKSTKDRSPGNGRLMVRDEWEFHQTINTT